MAISLSQARALPARRVLREEVADVIRNSILVGELPLGSRLDILAIANEMKVSQLPVREALIALSTEGLVRTEARRGYYVEQLDRTDVLDHYEIYGKISGVAAARAAASISTEQVDHLQRLNDQMRSSGDAGEQERLNYEIHRIINKVGGSRRLLSVLRPLAHGMDVRFGTIIPGWQTKAADEHDTIIAALRNRDAEGVRKAMEEHLIVNGRRAVDALDSAGFFNRTDGDGTAH